MFLKILITLMFVIHIEGGVTPPERKKQEKFEFALPPEGLIMDLVVKNRETRLPVAKVKFDINEKTKKVVLSLSPEPPPTALPILDDRNAIAVGTCPRGYTRAGAFCFKDDYDY